MTSEKDDVWKSVGARRHVDERKMEAVRRLEGVIVRLSPRDLVRWVKRLDVGDLGDERWLNRRLPSIMAAMKVAKMTPKGIWVPFSGDAEEGEESMGWKSSWANSMDADQ